MHLIHERERYWIKKLMADGNDLVNSTGCQLSIGTKYHMDQRSKMTGEELKAIRQSFGLSQSAFGDMLGFSIGSILAWEKGVRPPHADVDKRIEKMRQRNTTRGPKPRKEREE